MDTVTQSEQISESGSPLDSAQLSAARPNHLNIVSNKDLNSPSAAISTLSTPRIDDQLPLLRNEIERLLKQIVTSPLPQTNLVNSLSGDDNENLLNFITQKWGEISSATNASSGPVVNLLSPTSIATTLTLPAEVATTNSTMQCQPPNSTICEQDLCMQVDQANTSIISVSRSSPGLLATACQSVSSTPALLNNINSNLLPLAKAIESQLNPQPILHRPTTKSLFHSQPSPASYNQQHPLLPISKDTTTIHLPNGLRLEVSTKNTSIPQASVLELLGIVSKSSNATATGNSSSTIISSPPVSSTSTSSVSTTGSTVMTTLPWNDDDDSATNRPPSVVVDAVHEAATESPSVGGGSIDLVGVGDGGGGSSRSSVSSPSLQAPVDINATLSSQASASLMTSASQLRPQLRPLTRDIKVDPNEQFRMRLERKRARNRDAARKCRERKIRLIKTLEKNVQSLQDDTRLLRTLLTRSRGDIDRLKYFVGAHIDQSCPAITANIGNTSD